MNRLLFLSLFLASPVFATTSRHIDGDPMSKEDKAAINQDFKNIDLEFLGTVEESRPASKVIIGGAAPTTTEQNAVYAEMTPKVMAKISGSNGTIYYSVNVTSTTDLNCPDGCYRLNFTRPFSSANYYVAITPQDQSNGALCNYDAATISAKSVDVVCRWTSSRATTDIEFFIMAFGKQ